MIPTAEQLSALARVEQAKAALDVATVEHRLSIHAAVDAGLAKADVARAAGVTRQTVHNTVKVGSR